MTPRQLKYFREIARAGSLSAASQALNIAQPALSHHIAAMEEELGAQLLQRHPRGVELTLEGRRLLERADSILQQLGSLKSDVLALGGRPSGQVRLCIATALAIIIGPPLLAQVEESLPDIRLVLTTAQSSEVRTAVESRQVDLALMPNAFELPDLDVQPLYEEHLYLFGRASLLDDAGHSIRFDAIGARPLVAADRDHDLRRVIERVAVDLGCPLNVKYEINEPEVAIALIRHGLAFGIMPQSANIDLAKRGPERVVSLRVTDPALPRTQCMVRMADRPCTEAVEAVGHASVAFWRSKCARGACAVAWSPRRSHRIFLIAAAVKSYWSDGLRRRTLPGIERRDGANKRQETAWIQSAGAC